MILNRNSIFSKSRKCYKSRKNSIPAYIVVMDGTRVIGVRTTLSLTFYRDPPPSSHRPFKGTPPHSHPFWDPKLHKK